MSEGVVAYVCTIIFVVCIVLLIVGELDKRRKNKEEEKERKRKAKTKVFKYGHMIVCIGPENDDIDEDFDWAEADELCNRIDTMIKTELNDKNQSQPR